MFRDVRGRVVVFFRTASPDAESRDVFLRSPELFTEGALGLDLGPGLGREEPLGLALGPGDDPVSPPPSLLLCRDLEDLAVFALDLLRGIVP